MKGLKSAKQVVPFHGCDGLRPLRCLADEETNAVYVFVSNMRIDVEGDLGWVTDAGYGGGEAPDRSGQLVPIARWCDRMDTQGNLKSPLARCEATT
jgi:hypothetical protein